MDNDILPMLSRYILVFIQFFIKGLDNAGKTTILRKFCGEPIDSISPTLGFNIKSLEHHEGYTLNFWDVGGQKSIRAYWRNYFEATDGIIWVVDSGDQFRLDQCRQALVELLQQERLAGATLIIFANKQDIEGALSSEQIAEKLGLNTSDSFKNRHWAIHSCSAVSGEGLAGGVDWLVADIAQRIFMLS
ncbi:ADP-ribosylation factor [Seminavis robusta]|uniref:ADP-ribosylation factor n=1 Tax=Seminavis robusta TaxID=568900 RepID=A0A9N8EFK7_9STRA|nr:ADP-ribosylation factor [Seminavis robusta]|eukprot:Sro865_g212730.1 ADP-ribosylation factor (189) ;mRNA; f:682-1248